MQRIQQRRGVKGWHKPDGAMSVARPHRHGNPFTVAQYGRAECVRLYREYLAAMSPAELDTYLAPLRNATALMCFCKVGELCHADVLCELLEAQP